MNKRQKKKLYKKITGHNPPGWMQYKGWQYHDAVKKPWGGRKKIQKQNRDNVNEFAKRMTERRCTRWQSGHRRTWMR